MTKKSVDPAPPPYPWHLWLGIAIMVAAQLLLIRGSEFVATWMTPIMWTGYILTVDALVYKLQGRSWFKSRLREVPFLIFASVGIWILFEAYNFHLKNWQYVGLPENMFIRDLGFFWSFATIMPGVFETADLLNALFPKISRDNLNPPASCGLSKRDWVSIVMGALMVTLPLFLNQDIAAYLFALVWIGFIPLLDPINKRLGAPSLFLHWKNRNQRLIIIILFAGLICGFLWETWNYQAFQAQGAYWVYTIPQPLRIFGWHFGKMPILGLLGFPPFALELFAFYQLIRKISLGERIFGPREGTIP
jgi:hypothetical protein